MEATPTRSRQLPLPSFFALTYAISWCLWLVPLLATHGVLAISGGLQTGCIVVGSYGPLVASFIALYWEGRWPAMRDFARRCLRWRIGPVYLLAALLLLPALGFAAACVYARLGGPAVALAVPLAQIPLLFVVMFFLGGAVNEEFGWAYAIDRLQRGRPLLPAAIMLGALWGCWHLPLFFIVGVTQSFLPFWAFLLFAIALRVWFVWAYEGTGKSILATLLFHTTTNLTLNLFVLVDRSPQRNEWGFVAFALLALASAAALALTSRGYRRSARPLAEVA